MLPTSDEPRSVRTGEELDVLRLGEYLAEHLAGWEGPIVVEQFPSGYSNLTYLIRTPDRELVLRRPPLGNRVKSAHDMGREYRVLSHLSQVYEPAPKPVLFCEEASVIGAPFFLMERRRGTILRGSRGGPTSPQEVRRLNETLVEGLARLHAIDYVATGLGNLGKPEGFVDRQVTGWAHRYQDARTDPVPRLERVAAWLAENRPGESGAALIHNDYKFDNLVLDPDDPGRIVAVLDWEMATIGDPLMDLGTTLGYWIEPDDPAPLKALVVGPTDRPDSLSRREVVERYATETGRELGDMRFYSAFGRFKIAVIAQQIYARYVRGLTRDERFARLGEAVAALGDAASETIESGRI